MLTNQGGGWKFELRHDSVTFLPAGSDVCSSRFGSGTHACHAEASTGAGNPAAKAARGLYRVAKGYVTSDAGAAFRPHVAEMKKELAPPRRRKKKPATAPAPAPPPVVTKQ